MKIRKTPFFLLLLIFINCSNDEKDIINNCNTENLGITNEAQNTYINDFFSNNSPTKTKWKYKETTNELELSFNYGCGDECSGSYIFVLKKEKNCLIFKEAYTKSNDFFDGDSTKKITIQKFILQEWEANKKAVGKFILNNNEHNFWITLSE